MSHHHVGGTGVFVAAFLAHALWAGQVAVAAPPALNVTSAGYPYAGAACEFGAAGGSYCANPRNAGDMYDWGYWNGSSFDASDTWGYEYRNCTSYVAWRLSAAGVPASLFSDLGDASQWIANVRGEHGVRVDHTPSPGAVAAWDFAGVGHVAWVVSVRGAQVTVADYNYAGNGVFDEHLIGSIPTGYIHFPRLSLTDHRVSQLTAFSLRHAGSRSRWILLRSPGEGAAGGCGPLVPAGFGLGDGPAG